MGVNTLIFNLRPPLLNLAYVLSINLNMVQANYIMKILSNLQ